MTVFPLLLPGAQRSHTFPDTGFVEYAPHELQVKMIVHLSNWISNPAIFNFFVSAKEGESSIA